MVEDTIPQSLSSLSYSAGISNLSLCSFYFFPFLGSRPLVVCDFFPSLSYLRSLLVSQSPFFSDLP